MNTGSPAYRFGRPCKAGTHVARLHGTRRGSAPWPGLVCPLIHSKHWAGGAGGAACRPPWRRSRLCGGAGRPLRPRVLRRPLRPCILRGPLRLRGSLHAAPAHKSHAIAQSRCKAEGCRGVAALDQRARTCLKLYQQGTPKAEASHMELAGVISKQLITNSSGNLCTCAWGCAFELH